MSNELIWLGRILVVLLLVSGGLVGFTLATHATVNPLVQAGYIEPSIPMPLTVSPNLALGPALATQTPLVLNLTPTRANPTSTARPSLTVAPKTTSSVTLTPPTATLTSRTVTPVSPTTTPANPNVVLAAAGNIACDPSLAVPANNTQNHCRASTTADLLSNLRKTDRLDVVATLGDNISGDGSLEQFTGVYEPAWGPFKDITRPTAGNREYGATDAVGYYTYFGSTAGDPRKGYYSYDLGGWHVVVLNSNCSKIGGCGKNSAQDRWLRGELEQHAGTCTLAYWHTPLYSSSETGNSNSMQTLWQDLQDYGTPFVLTAHSSSYERFAPQDANGRADPNGIREFVVGTGGNNHSSLLELQPNTEVFNNNTFGILKLTLHPTSYDWQFIPEPGKTFADSGSGNCRPRHP